MSLTQVDEGGVLIANDSTRQSFIVRFEVPEDPKFRVEFITAGGGRRFGHTLSLNALQM